MSAVLLAATTHVSCLDCAFAVYVPDHRSVAGEAEVVSKAHNHAHENPTHKVSIEAHSIIRAALEEQKPEATA